VAAWKVERNGAVAVISLDDGKANTVLVPEFEGLEAALDSVEQSDATAVVLTGRPGFFSAGLNLKVLATLSLEDKQVVAATMGRVALKLFLFPKPVVAAVSGHALGAGAILAFAADTRIFADGSFKFGLNEVQVGLFVPSYGIALASSAVSASRLTDLVVHGRILSPMEALSMHVAEGVHSPEALLPAALIRARGLAAISGQGYATTKRLMREEAADRARAKIPGELVELARLMTPK
jgi:enoyl-CoA hydratase